MLDAEGGLDQLYVGVPNGSAEVRIAQSQTFSQVFVGGDSRLILEPGSSTLLETSFLVLSPLARLDLNSGALLIDYSATGGSPLDYVADRVRNARNQLPTPWTAPGITSSLAAENPAEFGVGYAEARDVLSGGGMFFGTFVPSGADVVPVQTARNGDANLDGVVDVSDFNRWNEHRFTGGTFWSSGDFNGDSITDVADFNLWNNNKFRGGPFLRLPDERPSDRRLQHVPLDVADDAHQLVENSHPIALLVDSVLEGDLWFAHGDAFPA